MNMISKPSFQFSHFSNYLFMTLEHIDLSQVKNRNPYILVPSECLGFFPYAVLSLSIYSFLQLQVAVVSPERRPWATMLTK